MTISNRTTISLVQFLTEIDGGALDLLLEKYGGQRGAITQSYGGHAADIVRDWATRAPWDQRLALLGELARTAATIRNGISPRYRFDERWAELCRCLELDGYRVDDNALVNIEPVIEGVMNPIDDLAVALEKSGLEQASEIQRVIGSSTENYVKAEPDYNACLVAARVALQTLANSIAAKSSGFSARNHQPDKWGQTVAFLRTEGFIGPAEEQGLTGVFTLTSPGAHRPIGLDEREFARLGRSLAISMTFFLIRRYNGWLGIT